MVKKVKAALIIIGDEILSGRTEDANLNHLAKWLGGLGIILDEVRVIPDVATRIQNAVNDCRATFDYVFTTGGIGPTHDDITAENVARAFGVELLLNVDAKKLLEDNMGKGNLTEARLQMAMIPDGASLILNPVSAAPGFQLENVFVLTDDLNLSFGTIRIKGQGSAGGHNGLTNINEVLQTQNYARLRFGIGSEFNKGNQIDHVLGSWDETERKQLSERIEKSTKAIYSFALAGLGNTMNAFNGK